MSDGSATPALRGAGEPGTTRLPAGLDRRFEALVFDWDGTAVPDRQADASAVRETIEALCSLGMQVAIVSGTHVGNVDGQLSQLLAWLNAHVGAITGAHNASAIAATAHNNISGVNVQSQLQEIVTDLAASGAGTAGSTLVGVDAIAGAPDALAAGTVRSQLGQLLGFVNALPRTNAANTWTATQELDGPAGEENPSITTVAPSATWRAIASRIVTSLDMAQPRE